MSIWFHENINLDDISRQGLGTSIEHMGIEFTEIGDDYLTGTMPVDHRTIQPIGILHGGSSCLLAETLGSIAANLCLDQLEKKYAVGMNINTSHIKSAKQGEVVTGTARAIHLGRSSQVWNIDIINQKQQLVSTTKLTMSIISIR